MQQDANKIIAQLSDELGQLRQRCTELKASLITAKEEAEHLRGAFETSLDAIMIIDQEGIIFFWNNAAAELFGYEVEEIIGQPITKLIPKEVQERYRRGKEHVLERGYSIFGKRPKETFGKRKDGTEFPIEIAVTSWKVQDKYYFGGSVRDISEQKRLEEEYETILNISQDLICIAGMDGYFKYVNPAWERLLGYSREELLTRPFLDFIHPEDHYKNDAAVETLSSGKILSDFENRYLHKNGSIRTFNWTAAALPEKGLMYCIGRDITERKQIEMELINTKDFLENIYNTTPDVLMVSDEKGYVIRVNKAVEKMLGFTQEELIGKHTSELFPKDEKHAQIGAKMITDLQAKGILKNLEANWLRKDGSFCPVELNITMLQGSDGDQAGAVAIIRDFTERKQHEEMLKESEERFRAIAESSPAAIITADSSGEILFWNEAAEIIYGYEAKEIVGKSIELLRPEGKRLVDRKNRENFIKTGHSLYIGKTVEGRARKKDGTEFLSETSTAAWKVGGKIMFCGIVRDITERRQMEEELIKAHDELENKIEQRTVELREANEELKISRAYLKKFAGMLLSVREDERKNISTTLHDELGSMALSVTSKISIAEEEIKENDNDAAIKALREGQAAVRQAVENLRRVAVDLRPPNLEIMGLTAALTELFDTAKSQAKFKIIFRNELGDKKIPEQTAIVIYRVIQEAITNIIKHAKAKSVRIRLFADKKNIKLDIVDDGIGFDMNKALYRKGKLKIGIEGMRERIESFGGEFTITSAPSQGTQLKVTMPKEQAKKYLS
jgi:PAS domain S-box-containing protein